MSHIYPIYWPGRSSNMWTFAKQLYCLWVKQPCLFYHTKCFSVFMKGWKEKVFGVAWWGDGPTVVWRGARTHVCPVSAGQLGLARVRRWRHALSSARKLRLRTPAYTSPGTPKAGSSPAVRHFLTVYTHNNEFTLLVNPYWIKYQNNRTCQDLFFFTVTPISKD